MEKVKKKYGQSMEKVSEKYGKGMEKPCRQLIVLAKSCRQSYCFDQAMSTIVLF